MAPLRRGSSLTNNGTIEGGSSLGGAGVQGIDSGGPGAAVTLINHGTIRGGSGLTVGGSGIFMRAGTGQLVNSGLIEGGNGAAAIVSNSVSATFNLINSGTIRAGAGQADAIRLFAGSTGTLELQAGSVIEGNVVASATTFSDVLRLGGTADSSFDVSAIGPAAQYQNFDTFQKTGSSTWTLTGTGTTSTPWSVQQGTLLVNGSTLGGAGVLSGAILGGTGTIGGDVVVGTGGTLAPGGAGAATGTLTVNGNLVLSNGSFLSYNFGQAGVVGGPLNDLLNVQGDLTLNGRLDVTTAPGGSFDPGIYRVINYTGSLFGNGLTVGSVPSSDFFLQTTVTQQINLVNTAGLALNFWDGAASARNDGAIGGGDGLWQSASGNDNWTNELGVPNAAYASGSFAIFQGAPGTVTVDNSLGAVTASGMQFASNGYVVRGEDIELTGPRAVIRVGDGTSIGAGYSARIDANLTGSAQLVKSDLGILTFTGTNSYTGGTVISGGSLLLGNGGTTGSIQGDVVTNGILGFNRSDAVTFGGAISGSGMLLQMGSGTTTLTGANTYSGGTVIADGTLIGQVASFGSGGIINNAALVFDQPSDASFANFINGNGSLTKRGAGSLNLTGTGNLIGPTTVAAGTLAVNGSLANSAVTVLSGATLAGAGTVGATTIQSGATIAPGNSIGTLNVAGNVGFAAGSTYAVEIDAAGRADRLAATGHATLSGGTVQVLPDQGTGYVANVPYTIVTATGGVTGAFSGTKGGEFAFVTPTLGYNNDAVTLTLVRKTVPPTPQPPTPTPTPVAFHSVAVTRNQYSTANGVEALGAGNRLYDTVLGASVSGARQAFTALSGEAHASAITVAYEDDRLVREAILTRLRQPTATSLPAFAQGSYSAAYAADLPGAPQQPVAVVPSVDPRRFALWGEGFGSWGQVRANGNAAGLDRSTGGFILGADAQLDPAVRLGVAGGFTRTSFDIDGRLSSGSNESVFGALYGSGRWGAINLRLGASYASHDIDVSRTVIFPGFGDAAEASYDGSSMQAFGELGYGLALGSALIEPFVGASVLRLHIDSFQESGGAAALTGFGRTYELGTTTLGVRAEARLSEAVPLTLRGLLGWRRAYGDVEPAALLAFAGGASAFVVSGVPVERNALAVEAGLDCQASDAISLGVAYSGQIGSHAQDHALKGNFTWRFDTR